MDHNFSYTENGRSSDCYCFLFNDMFMITKVKKITVKSKVRVGGWKNPNAKLWTFFSFPEKLVKLQQTGILHCATSAGAVGFMRVL